ncbi:MAG TPA: Fur family transcriptional regulator [Amycolatopsis sp.]|uniref:Fur family transcriptional regulator n=1 Tax=Amycolatopsis sp. TaxID=37632 RepID=UPI002B462F06|nr:Fur family transcriptional regulator [Amycolatopsis sp.]HKS49792.1 Fur family transcriptional regulator [Amycolatopsis sp.]
MHPDHIRARCREELRARRMRFTSARLSIMDTLGASTGHLSAAEIHHRISTAGGHLNLSTVYRTLDRLTESGLVHRLPGQAQVTYGLAVEPHHHAVCNRCGTIQEIPAPALADALRATAKAIAFRPESVVVTGLCPACQA